MKKQVTIPFICFALVCGMTIQDLGITHEIVTKKTQIPPALGSPPENNGEELPLIRHEAFFGEPEIAEAQLSPDGQYLAFRKPWRGVSNLWVKPMDGSFDEAYPVTRSDRAITEYFWSEDGQFLLYLQDEAGDENDHLFVLSPQGNPETPPRNLTPLPGVKALIIAVPENRPQEIIVGLNDRDPRYHDLYRINIITGKRTLLRQNNQQIVDWFADLAGHLRLAVQYTPGGGLEILRLDADRLTPIYRCTIQETCSILRFHPNGKQVYIITNRGKTIDKTRLILLNLQTLEQQLVDFDPQQAVDFGFALYAEKDEQLLATYYERDRWQVYPQDPEFAKDWAFLKRMLPPGTIFFGSASADDRLQLISLESDRNPGSVYLFNREQYTLQHLYDLNLQLSPETLAPMQSIRYRARDGLEITGYLTLPLHQTPQQLPLVVFPHGGPWSRDSWGYNPYVQFLANRGYAVFQPNFRGSTGYGKAFLNAGNREWGTGAMQHDITDGVHFLIDQGLVDRQRIAIFGISYGGFAALAGLAFTPDLYQGGISYVGISNIITFLQSIPPYWKPFENLLKLRVGDPTDPQDISRLQCQSPLYAVEQIQAPLLVIQGANDPRVKPTESAQMVIALRDLGREVEYLLAPDEGHGFVESTNRLAVAVAMERFLADHLGGRYQQTLSPVLQARLEKLTVDIDRMTRPRAEVQWGGVIPQSLLVQTQLKLYPMKQKLGF